MKNINNIIKKERTRRGITQEELAIAINVSRQTIVNLEKGTYDPSLALALKISHYFHEPVENIFFWE